MAKLDIIGASTFRTIIMTLPYNDAPAEGESCGPEFPEGMDVFMAIRLKKRGVTDIELARTNLYVLIGFFDVKDEQKLLDEDLTTLDSYIIETVLNHIFNKDFVAATGLSSLADIEYKALYESHKYDFPAEIVEVPQELIDKYDVLLGVELSK